LRKKLTAASALKPPGLVDASGNVVKFPERDDDTAGMGRAPTSIELKLAAVLYETHEGGEWSRVVEGSETYWIYIKTVSCMIHEMRALPFDITQKIRGKPFHDAKDIWETIIDACSP